MSQSNTDELAKQLEHGSYYGLFGAPDSRQRLDALLLSSGALERLLRIAADAAQPWRKRFLAAEIIFHRQMFLLMQRPEHFASLAAVYAQAITENASGYMFHWGFREGMDDSGELGSRFVVFGRDADPALRPLLDENRQVPFVDPPDLPFKFRPGFRIKDFVALYLSKIHKLPILLTDDPAQRDQEILRLKGLLP